MGQYPTLNKLPSYLKNVYCPLYTTLDNVKVLLANKVQFQSSADYAQDGELPDALLGALISRAESYVEQELRGRYKIPFQDFETQRFCDLLSHTKRQIQTVVDLKAVHEALTTDFGRGSNINAEAYAKSSKDGCDEKITLLLGRNQEAAGSQHNRFRFTPPLDRMALAPTNSEADNGFRGTIINIDASHDCIESNAEHALEDKAYPFLLGRGINW